MRRLGVRNRASIALLVALLAVLGVSSAWSGTSVSAQDGEVIAAAITPGSDAVVDDGPLNQRSQPNTGGTVLQVLATGTLVNVISGPTSANGYNWWYVTANGTDGYVVGQYLAEVGYPIGSNVVVNSNYVNIRSGPGTTYGVTDQLSTGATAQVIGGPSAGNGYTWYQIQYQTSLTGWIAGMYLTLSGGPPSGTFGVNSWIMLDDPPVNLRSGPGTTYAVTGSLNNNYQPVQVTGTATNANGYTWYPIATLGNVTGYVAGDFFEGGIYLNDYAIVADGPLNLRATASSSGTILTTMPNNASIFINNVTPVHANGIAWFNVTYNSTTGWAAGMYLGDA
ncbi:MAG: SH3 domain-containing protein [Thermomicrobiales bacterium]|nr:SH3 domain-containing protein [Thermomicrobiales bacterium]